MSSPAAESQHSNARLARVPWLTLALAAACVAGTLLPRLSERLVLERAALEAGEYWRLLGGHLVHGNGRLLATDVLGLALVGAWVEARSRGTFARVTVLSALASGLAVWWSTSLERYVGSSALSFGLFACAALQLLRERPRSALAGAALAGLGLLFVRIGLEFAGAWPAAWSALPAGVSPEPVAHLTGALVGLATGSSTLPGSIPGKVDSRALQLWQPGSPKD